MSLSVFGSHPIGLFIQLWMYCWTFKYMFKKIYKFPYFATTFLFLSHFTCKWPNSYIISYSCFTTGSSMFTKWQNRVRSSIIAILRDFLSTSSSSAFCWFTEANDESIRLCKLSDAPFFAFFCRRNVSLERFFNSLRQRLYSLVWSLSRITTWRFHSSNLSCDKSNQIY